MSHDTEDSVFERLVALLDQRGVHYRVLRHEPVFTSEQAAQIRGTTLASGAKALICKADGDFKMFVMPADRRLASKRVRKERGYRSLRFASQEEVADLTSLRPGSIPPFGSLFTLPTLCDRGLADQPEINFNAGDNAISIGMAYADFAQVEMPELGNYAE